MARLGKWGRGELLLGCEAAGWSGAAVLVESGNVAALPLRPRPHLPLLAAIGTPARQAGNVRSAMVPRDPEP